MMHPGQKLIKTNLLNKSVGIILQGIISSYYPLSAQFNYECRTIPVFPRNLLVNLSNQYLINGLVTKSMHVNKIIAHVAFRNQRAYLRDNKMDWSSKFSDLNIFGKVRRIMSGSLFQKYLQRKNNDELSRVIDDSLIEITRIALILSKACVN